MRIAIVTELFYPSIGGQEIRFLEFSKKFSEVGHEVDVFTIDSKGDLPKFDEINNIQIQRLISDKNYRGGVFGRKMSTVLKFSFKVCKALSKGNYDLIIFNQWPIFPPFILKSLYKTNATTIIDFVEFRSSFIWKFFNYLMLNFTDKIVFISDSVQRAANKINFKNIPSKVIPSVVHINDFIESNGNEYLFLGRIEPHKNPEFAINSIVEYNKLNEHNIKLNLIGGGSLLESLKEKYNDDNIIFHGKVSDEDKINIISRTKALVLPSQREGLPKSIIECMVSGVPTITTKYPDNASWEFVSKNEIGISVDPEIKNLVNAIKEIELNHKTYKENCLRIKENYSVEFNSKEYLKFAKK